MSHYINLCRHYIRLPQEGDFWKFPDGQVNFLYPWSEKDQDCGRILDATASMTEFEANVWFCDDHPNHTVFKRQTGIHNLPQATTQYKSHQKKCGVWKKDRMKKDQARDAVEKAARKKAVEEQKKADEAKKKEQAKKHEEHEKRKKAKEAKEKEQNKKNEAEKKKQKGDQATKEEEEEDWDEEEWNAEDWNSEAEEPKAE